MTTGVLMSPVSHSASLVKAKAVDNGMQERKLMADFYCISLCLLLKRWQRTATFGLFFGTRALEF